MLIIKQLRRKKNMSQTNLANSIGVSLRTIQLYEKKNANIPIKNLTKIANHFDIGIDQLYANEVNESGTNYDKKKKLLKGHRISKLGPGKYLLEAPLITDKLQMNFIEKHGNNVFINSLPSIGFVLDQVSVASYLAFEISNASMDNGLINGIPKKAIVLCKQIAKKEVMKRAHDSNAKWVIVHKNSVMCKEITHYNRKNGIVTCHSLNNSPEFPDFVINLEEVKAFYMIIKKQID